MSWWPVAPHADASEPMRITAAYVTSFVDIHDEALYTT